MYYRSVRLDSTWGTSIAESHIIYYRLAWGPICSLFFKFCPCSCSVADVSIEIKEGNSTLRTRNKRGVEFIPAGREGGGVSEAPPLFSKARSENKRLVSPLEIKQTTRTRLKDAGPIKQSSTTFAQSAISPYHPIVTQLHRNLPKSHYRPLSFELGLKET